MDGTVVVVDLGRLPYEAAHRLQVDARDALIDERGPQTLFLVEHDPVVTLGRRGNRGGILSERALAAAGIPVLETERGGDVTYHGPGQLVAYPILDLRKRDSDVRRYVEDLERTALRTLESYGLSSQADPERHGVYTTRGKIASIGVHVSHWITMHGIALNIDPDMEHWSLIAPCNLPDVQATSMAAELPLPPLFSDVKERFVEAFSTGFAIPIERGAADGRTTRA